MTVMKYSASGNDFVIFHTFLKKDRSKLAQELCDRQNGVGADGLIVLLPHESEDFEWQFYNSDGSEAEMCGNGSRACAHYAFSNELASQEMSFATLAGVIHAQVNGNMVLSELTPPKILQKDIIFNEKNWWKIDTGVPHMVSFTENIEEFDREELRELRYKYDANVNIVFVDQDKNLQVRTYERGVEDETLACGTGMAASFYRAFCEGKISDAVEVYPRSKETLHLTYNGKTITFKGKVKRTFTAEL